MAVEVINTRYEVLETFPSSETTPFVLHKARDVEAGSTVLLKVLPAAIARRDPRLVARMRTAIEAASGLEHPMAIRAFDAGAMPDGGVYWVSDYVRGITLKERIRRIAPFSLAVACDIAVNIAEAVAAAHSIGVLHGRLLPEHVVLSPEGRICVGEFEVAPVVMELLPDAAATRAYMPPDSDEADEPTVSADIYAVGAILYEMLTGVQPATVHGTLPISPRSINPGVPPALEGITLKALHPDVDIQYRDAAGLLADLQAARSALRSGRNLTWSPLSSARAARQSAANERTRDLADNRIGGDYDDDAEELSDDRPYREPTSVLTILVRVALFIAVCAVVGLCWYVAKVLEVPGDVSVPSLIGMTIDDADKQAQDKNFIIAQGKRDFSTKWAAGQIYAQDPAAGSTIKAGKAVTIFISEGPQFLTVPDLVGMTGDQAQRALHDTTLPAGDVTEQFSDTVPKGIVISQAPNPGANVDPYRIVKYAVSEGRQLPDPPTDVEADALGPDRVQVTWDAGARANTYIVDRILDGDVVVVAHGLKDTKLVDAGLQPNTSYSYTVTSVNEVGESTPSDPTLAVTSPSSMGTEDANDTNATVSPDPDVSTITPPDTTPASSGSAATQPDTHAAQPRQFRIAFRLPSKPDGDHRVRFEVQDSTGTTLVYDEVHHAGDSVDVPVTGFGNKITFRIFVDDILMKQQTL